MKGQKPARQTGRVQSSTAGFPKAPSWLRRDARKVWSRIAAEMNDQLICSLDVDVFAAYCSDVALFIKAERQIDVEGEVVKSPKGYPIQNPWLAIRNRAQQRVAKASGDLGLNPAARDRLNLSGPPKVAAPVSRGYVKMKIAQ